MTGDDYNLVIEALVLEISQFNMAYPKIKILCKNSKSQDKIAQFLVDILLKCEDPGKQDHCSSVS